MMWRMDAENPEGRIRAVRQPCHCPGKRQWWLRYSGGNRMDSRQEQPSSTLWHMQGSDACEVH